MRLIVGLGNPDEKYLRTRHNIGFHAVEKVAEYFKASGWKKQKDGLVADFLYNGQKVLLFKPMKYMNLSGRALRSILDFYQIDMTDVLVLCDDVYLAPGVLRIRQGGGNGGHNGIKSIEDHLASSSFARIRVGVGVYDQDPQTRENQPALEKYVLEKISDSEHKKVEAVLDKAMPELVNWLEQGKVQEVTVYC